MFRIRVDIVNDLNSDQLIEVCGPDTYVIVRHELPTGNPHYHAYFKYNSDIKENTLRQRFKRKFGFLKSSDYSIKKCDEERTNEYVQYMFNTKHGNRWELISTFNFDDTTLRDLIQAAKQISSDFANSKESTKKNTGPTIWDLAQEVEAKFIDIQKSKINFHQLDSDRIIIYTDVAIETLRKHRKPFDEFLLRKVITTAMSTTEKGKEIMRYKMLKNFNML